MKVKLGQLVVAGGTPQNPGPLSNLIAVEGFCVRTAYHIAKLAKKVNDELVAFNQTKNMLIEKYGAEMEGGRGKSVTPESENWEEFAKEYSALMEQEVDLDVTPVILPPEAEGVTAETLVALDGLVTVRGEKDEKPALKLVE